jgi:hypothetical protein
MRVPMPIGMDGSLKWIQRATNDQCKLIDKQLLSSLPRASRIEWRSPLASDGYAEYRDSGFLERIGHADLADRLAEFWPARGPQWDALGTTDTGEVILVEAKAHIDEMFSPGCQASERPFIQISDAFNKTISAFGAKPAIDWTGSLYQMANRYAFLHFLAANGVSARLVFVCFVGDAEMNGPESADEWRGALHVARRMLGLPKRSRFPGQVIDVFPHVSQFQLPIVDAVDVGLTNADAVAHCHQAPQGAGMPTQHPIEEAKE